jgi:uncharacterized integral membrane protein
MKGHGMNTWKMRLIVALMLAIVAIIWILQNGDMVQTKFLFITVTMPQSALLAITLLLGGVAGMFLALSMSGRWRRKG